jgi:O-antigen/teichoic acid export membrane protein
MHPIIRLFKIPPALAGETQAVFLIGMIIFAVSSILKPFEAIQGGLQRMDISNKITIAVSLPNIAGTVFFLEKGYGLLGLVINTAIIVAITNIINIIAAFKILPELRITLFAFDKKTFRMLFGFGIKRWITSIEEIVLFQTDKLLISHFLTLSLVGFYQLGSAAINKVRLLALMALPAIVPAASELDAMRRREEIIRLYLKGTKYMFGLSIPVFTFLFASAHLIMFIWMGQGYHASALVIQLMAASIIVMNFSAVGSAIAVGIGRPEFQMEAAAGQAILNIALSIILIIKIGFIGVLIATLISVILSTAYFMRRLHKYLNLSMGDFVNKTMVVYLLLIFTVGILIYFFNQRLNYLIFGRLGGLTILTLEAVLFFFCYFILLRKISFLDKEDMGYLMAVRSSIGL